MFSDNFTKYAKKDDLLVLYQNNKFFKKRIETYIFMFVKCFSAKSWKKKKKLNGKRLSTDILKIFGDKILKQQHQFLWNRLRHGCSPLQTLISFLESKIVIYPSYPHHNLHLSPPPPPVITSSFNKPIPCLSHLLGE